MPKLLLAVLCDDVRYEFNNKTSLMGLFTGFLVRDYTQPMPPFYIFAKVGFEASGQYGAVVRLRSSEGEFQGQVTGTLVAGDESFDDGEELYVGNMPIRVEQLRIPRPGRYYIDLIVDDKTLGSLAVMAKTAKPPTQH